MVLELSAGLFGAAATSAFWAAIGGGSLASGGLGMAGGYAILAAIGSTTILGLSGTVFTNLLLRKIPQYEMDANLVTFLAGLPQIYVDTIIDQQGREVYSGSFKALKYEGQGTIYDLEGQPLIQGTFENGRYIAKKCQFYWYCNRTHNNKLIICDGTYRIYHYLYDDQILCRLSSEGKLVN